MRIMVILDIQSGVSEILNYTKIIPNFSSYMTDFLLYFFGLKVHIC